jgi:molybdopterin-guanine dinucleotide biosynthesis protein A
MTDRVAGIVLAGGRSARFGRDKLREPIDGRPLLDHAIDAVRLVCDEVVVVVGVGDVPPIDAEVRLVHDVRPFEGPLAAVALGLASTDADRCLVVGGDMPSLVPAVLRRLVAALDDGSADVAVLDAGGHHRPLPMAVRRSAAATAATALIERDEHRLRALRDALPIAVVPDPVWQADDPSGSTLRDIDRPTDLP